MFVQRLRTVHFLVFLLWFCASCSSNGGSSSEPTAVTDVDAVSSLYILPYPVGLSYVVGQGNNTDGSHTAGSWQAYAYDFDIPIGTSLIASRAGRVIALEERFTDGTRISGEENFVVIQHQDNTVAGYYHLTHNGALVAIGDQVAQGALIAISGDSGDSSEPHLHFEVLDSQNGATIPVRFRNTRPHPDGLVEGESYLAEPY